jgi:sigma-B regulation protein RsbU (phosphoserine phosphatase)
LHFARAGHPQPLHIHGDNGHIEVLADQSGKGGPALGLMPGVNYNTTTVSLSPRDRILLFTDGLIEAESPNNREFGLDGLTDSLHRNLDRPGRLLELIEGDVRCFAGSNDIKDDICFVMIQWNPSG